MARELNEQPLRIRPRRATTESYRWRLILIGVALAYLAFFLILPLIAVFTEAMRKGPGEFFAALADPGSHLRHSADASRRRYRRAAQSRLRPRRLMGHRQI